MATIRPESVDGIAAFAIEDDRLSAVVVPDVGAKVVSFRHRATGREWIWRNPSRKIVRPRFGSGFHEWDISGYDDCFPTIGVAAYPEEPWLGVEAADHGEVWTLPWQAAVDGDDLVLSVHGVRFPYHLTKRLSPGDDGLRITYELTNPTPFAFKYLFSAHPLFAVTATTEIDLADGTPLRVDSSIGGRLGARPDRHTWPLARDASGRPVDLRRLDPKGGHGDKLYAGPLANGHARLVDRATGDWVGFTWDPGELPLLGLWINQGGWPSDGEPCFNVALEPCSGFPDPLDLAVYGGEHSTIGGGEIRRWSLLLNAGQETTGPPLRT